MYDEYLINTNDIHSNCNCFITEQMIYECCNNSYIVKQQAILEGAKFDLFFSNFLKEGKDYKGLKKDLNDIIKANSLSTDKLKTGKNGIMHKCKRVIQILLDISGVLCTGGDIVSIGIMGISSIRNSKTDIDPRNLFKLIKMGLGFVIGFLITKVLRFAVDSVEFKSIEKDCKTIISDLNKASNKAKKNGDNELADHYDNEAKRLEKALKVYSNKSKIKESLIFDNIELI